MGSSYLRHLPIVFLGVLVMGFGQRAHGQG